MEKEEFKELEVLKQVEYINSLLVEKQTLTKITHDLEVVRSTLTRNFKKASYVYNPTSKQYVQTTLPQNVKKEHTTKYGKKKVDHKIDQSVVNKLDNRPVRRLKFSIPVKTKLKNTTKAFNVVMDKMLVERIDKLCKAKGGYSRNELINKMCRFSLDNMED